MFIRRFKRKNEKYSDCIIREVKEELNIILKNPKFLTKISYVYKTKNKKINNKYFYFVKLKSNEIKKFKLNEGQK